jgi:hypothetical protein
MQLEELRDKTWDMIQGRAQFVQIRILARKHRTTERGAKIGKLGHFVVVRKLPTGCARP